MIEESINWNKETLRTLRLRLGWSRSELAHHLHCSSEEVEMWESGQCHIHSDFVVKLELIFRQAETCSDEVKITPVAEKQCEKNELEQIHFSRVKEDFE
ncbi:MAG: helix-turn-helix domain-containing protein [Bdellovibrio sp.]